MRMRCVILLQRVRRIVVLRRGYITLLMVVLRMILARKIMHRVLRQHHPLGKLVPQLTAVDCCQYRGSDLEKREDDEQDTPYQPRGRVRAARATETKRTMANRAVHRHAPCADEHRNASLDCDAHRPAHEAAHQS